MRATLILTVAVEFDEGAEELTGYGIGQHVDQRGDVIARALVAEISTAITNNPVIDGCHASLGLHSHVVIDDLTTPTPEGNPR